MGTLLVSTPATLGAAETPIVEVSFAVPVEMSEPIVTISNQQAPEPNIRALISQVAAEYDVSSTTLYNVAWSESRLNPDPPGHNDGGLACGVVQVHADIWNLDCDELKEKPEIGLTLLAKRLQIGDAWKYWTPLNCYTYVSHLVPLPRMAEITPNSKPKEGSVAIFQYSNGVKHIAYVTDIHDGGFTVKEANFKSGLIGTRTIGFSDPFLVGFYAQ